MLGGKKKYKAKFEMKVEKIEGLPDKIKGNPFRIEYARGKDHTGISRSLTMTSANMSVNYSFKFECNILYEEKKGVKKFSEKSLVFQVVAEKSKDVKKEANIAKCEFDLATVAIPGEYEPRQRLECHGKDKKDVKCILVVSFKTEVLKIDGKKLVKVDYSKSKSSKTKESKAGTSASADVDPYGDLPEFGEEQGKPSKTIEVDGEEYDLQTDMDLSEGGLDSDNDAKTENDYLSDSDEKNDPFEEDEAPSEAELKKLKQMEEEEAAAKLEKERKEKEEKEKMAADKAEKDKKDKEDKERKEKEEKAEKERKEKEEKAEKDKKDKEEKERKAAEEKKAKEEEKKRKEEEDKKKKEEDKRIKDEEKKKKDEEKKKKDEEEEKKKKLSFGGMFGKKDKESKDTKDTKETKETKDSKDSKDIKDSKDSKDTKDTKDTKDSSSPDSAPVAPPAAPVASTSTEKPVSTEKSSSTKSSSKEKDSASSSKAQQQEHERALSILEDRMKTLTQERDSAMNELIKTKQDLSSERETVLSLKKELRILEPRVEDLQAENDRLKDKLGNGGSSTNESDSAEINRLENQVRNLRIEKQEMQTELEHVQNKLREVETSMQMYDIEYSQKCIGDLEIENAKLRKLLDDSDLLTGDLIQELKHRQSERQLRVEKHNKDVEAGMANPAEITGYKKHSRQSSVDSNASSSKSPRMNGPSSESVPKQNNQEQVVSPSVSKSVKSPPISETKKTKKSSQIKMDDDSNTPNPVRSKRVANPTPVIDDYTSGFATDSSELVKNLESKLKHGETIESLFYNAKTLYDQDGNSLPALHMADYLLDTQSMDRNGQHSESSHAILVHIIAAIYGQTQRHTSDIDVLVGMFQWGLTLLKTLITKTEFLEDAPANSHMTWATNVHNVGIVLKYEAVIDFTETMGDGALDVEKAFDDCAADATPGEAFLVLLDQMISYIYTLIFACVQQFVDEHRLVELFFGQTSQLAAALNGSNPHARSAHTPGKPRPVTVRPMGHFTAQLDIFLGSSRRHHLPKTIESQLLGQLFFWCSATIVNALVTQPDKCSAATGMSLKVAISHVEQWISHNTQKTLSSWVEDQFAAAREAANVLTIDKRIFQSIDALEGIFNTLNIAQIHKLLSQFQTDDFSPDPVSKTTLEVLKSTIAKTNLKVTFLDGTTLITLDLDE